MSWRSLALEWRDEATRLIPRRAVLAAGVVLSAGARAEERDPVVVWQTGEGGRTDPFVSWVVEVMRARHGIMLRRAAPDEPADLATTDRPAPAIAWRQTQFCLLHTGAPAPASLVAWLAWAKRNPGRSTHAPVTTPQGMAFFAQALHELAPDPALLRGPILHDAPLNALAIWYARLRPLLWRGGATVPFPGAPTWSLLHRGEIDIAATCHAGEAAFGQAQQALPDDAQCSGLTHGAILRRQCAVFASRPAERVARFLGSAQAQAHAQSVVGPAMLISPALPPLHPAWIQALAAAYS